jgi:hypothetical protein
MAPSYELYLYDGRTERRFSRKDNMSGHSMFNENEEGGRHVRGMRDKAEVKV